MKEQIHLTGADITHIVNALTEALKGEVRRIVQQEVALIPITVKKEMEHHFNAVIKDAIRSFVEQQVTVTLTVKEQET